MAQSRCRLAAQQRSLKILLTLFLALFGLAPGAQIGRGGTGTIRGHIHLTGKLPGNPVIRIGVDPKCAAMNNGKLVVQETVMAAADGSLGNVFVSLQGTFPSTPLPDAPVIVDQQACIYRPRVAGVRVGQTIEFRNSDALLHDVHGSSTKGNAFNVGQPAAGMVYRYTPMHEELMLQLKCDIHSWMTAYLGVMPHPYFAVTNDGGSFTIVNVPAGTHTIQAWHEQYGVVTKSVRVAPGATAIIEFEYRG